jgi:hypothetical protein
MELVDNQQQSKKARKFIELESQGQCQDSGEMFTAEKLQANVSLVNTGFIQ